MNSVQRQEEARKAYTQGDVQAAAVIHTPTFVSKTNWEKHGAVHHQYIGDIVYGGLGGIITRFAAVSSVSGARLGSNIALIVGLANLVATGIANLTGTYISAKSEQEYYQREWEREAWELQHFPEGERAELYEVYRDQGYSDEDAHWLVEIKTRDPQLWLKAMMSEELGLVENDRKPLVKGLASLAAVLVAGVVPLLVYLIGLAVPIPWHTTFLISLGLSGLAMFGLGAAKVHITENNLWISGLEMLGVGGLTAGVAYAVGALLRGLAG